MSLTSEQMYDRVAAILTASPIPKVKALASRITDAYKVLGVCAEPCGINFSRRGDFTVAEKQDLILYLLVAEQPSDECFISDAVCRGLEFVNIPARVVEMVLTTITSDAKYKGAWKSAARLTKTEDRYRQIILSNLGEGDETLIAEVLESVRDATKFKGYLDHPDHRVQVALKRAGIKLAMFTTMGKGIALIRHRKVADGI